jgi:uncharacterized protein
LRNKNVVVQFDSTQVYVGLSGMKVIKRERNVMTENPEMAGMEVSDDDRLFAALAYVFSPLVPIIILLMEDKKNRPFIRAHNAQALAIGIVMIIVVPIIAALTLGCGAIIYFIMLYWAYKAYQGETINIPVITDFVRNQGWA